MFDFLVRQNTNASMLCVDDITHFLESKFYIIFNDILFRLISSEQQLESIKFLVLLKLLSLKQWVNDDIWHIFAK